MSASLKLRLAQGVMLAIFLALGISHSVIAPFNEGPDEVAHFQFARFIAKYRHLPTTLAARSEAGYKSDWPPLFHIVVGLIGSGIDLDSPPFVKVAQDNPRLQLVVGHDNIISWRALTTEDPYQGEVLLWYLGRWVTLLFGTIGIGTAFLLLRAQFPYNIWLALSAATILAFNPTYIRISSVISYEPLLGALLAFYFLLLFYTIQHPSQNWCYLGLGLLMGAAILTKYTPLPAVLVLPFLVIWLAYQKRWAWRATLWRIALVVLGLTLTFGSWVLYAEIYYNRVSELGWILGLLSPFVDSSDDFSRRVVHAVTGGALGGALSQRESDTLFEWAWHMFREVWGGRWLAWIFLGLWGLALAGLVRQWRRGHQQIRLWIFLLAAHVGLFTVLPLARFFVSRSVSSGMGQHVLFPAGAALVILLVLGLNAWLPSIRLAGIFLVVAVIGIWQNIDSVAWATNPRWPIQTVPFSTNEQVIASFDEISLVNYEYDTEGQALEVTFRWRAEVLINEDYQIELTLLDSAGQPQARWLGQPLNGSYPTRAWMPGDRIRDVIYVPMVGLRTGDYHLHLRLLGESGPVIPIKDGDQPSVNIEVAKQGLLLDHITIAQPIKSVANTIQLNGQEFGYILWQQDVPATKIPVYNEQSTIVISTREKLSDEIRLSLLGPDGKSRAPLDHTGFLYNFIIEPYFASGDYHLRFEWWSGDEVVEKAETPTLVCVKTQERQFEIGSISHPVSANFANQVALLGYDLPQRRVQAGDELPVTLHWQGLRTIGANLIMFNRFIDQDQKVWGGRDRLAREVYSTMLWAPGEIVTDPFTVRVDASAPDGMYHLLVGLYLPVGQAPVSLPLVQDGQLSDATSIKVGPIKVGKTPTGLTVDTANPQVQLNQPFGDPPVLTLLGYDLTDEADHSIVDFQSSPSANLQSLKLTLYWRSESILPLDYTTFVHLRNDDGEIIAQRDQPPLNGAYPTSLWEPGEIIADEIIIPVPTELPDEEYQIVVGLYDFQTGQRLNIPDNPASEIGLAGVKIP